MRYLVISFLLLSLTVQAQVSYPVDKVKNYILRYKYLAVQNMVDFRIPASIIMGQALLESGYGSSPLALKANNHFGIKCKPEWRGRTYHYNDDAPHECFRCYPSVEESFKDHAVFLANRIYYKSLFNLNMSDYKAWAKGLKKAGYATNPQYAYKLIELIERYELQQLDKEAVDIIVLNEQRKAQALQNITLKQFDALCPIYILNYRQYELLNFNQSLDFNCHNTDDNLQEVSNACLDIAISVAYLRDEEE